MNRRNFIKSKVAGTAILASSGLVCKATAKNPPAVNKDTSILDVDILVVGGLDDDSMCAFRYFHLHSLSQSNSSTLLKRNTTRFVCVVKRGGSRRIRYQTGNAA